VAVGVSLLPAIHSLFKTRTMTELINKLVAEAGLSQEQAAKTIGVIKDFVSEKFPMLAGAVDNVLGAADAGGAIQEGGGLLDKISDIIPGEIGEKIEGFAKQAANKFGDLEGKV
jgi:hypothetical protein